METVLSQKALQAPNYPNKSMSWYFTSFITAKDTFIISIYYSTSSLCSLYSLMNKGLPLFFNCVEIWGPLDLLFLFLHSAECRFKLYYLLSFAWNTAHIGGLPRLRKCLFYFSFFPVQMVYGLPFLFNWFELCYIKFDLTTSLIT